MNFDINRKLGNSQSLKFACYDLLVQESLTCNMKYNIAFKWQLFDGIGTIENIDVNKIEVSINLRAVKQKFLKNIENTAFHVCSSICYLASYISLVDAVNVMNSETYFEWMAQANVICDLQLQKKVYLFSPVMIEKKKTDKRFRLTACEVLCAINAVKRAKEICREILSEEDNRNIERQLREWELYALLPEVSYQGSDIPEYAAFDVLKRLFEGVNKKLEDEILFRIVIYSEKITGDMNPCTFEQLSNQYREKSVEYIQACKCIESKLLEDNLIAVEKTIRRINEVMERQGLNGNSGTIHPLV